MNLAITSLAIVLAIFGVLVGWLVPAAFRSHRPYGLWGDILACIVCMVGLGIIEWQWILPALNITGGLKLAAVIGDPLFLALIVLWLLRRIKGPEVAR